MPNKTGRHDARGLAQIVRTAWFKLAQIKSHEAYVNRAMLTAREALVGMRVKMENEIRGLLKIFGIIFGKQVGGFRRRVEEIIEGELAVAPELLPIFEALTQARRDILARIAALDSRIRSVARKNPTVRLLCEHRSKIVPRFGDLIRVLRGFSRRWTSDSRGVSGSAAFR